MQRNNSSYRLATKSSKSALRLLAAGAAAGGAAGAPALQVADQGTEAGVAHAC